MICYHTRTSYSLTSITSEWLHNLLYLYIYLTTLLYCTLSWSGYIAVELAGVFNGLGTDTSLFVRGDKALRSFDTMLSTQLDVREGRWEG